MTFENVRQELIKNYDHWKIEFPIETFENKQYTHLHQNRWSIYYQFCKDGVGEYVEVYALHPMSDGSRYKLYIDRTYERLSVISPYCLVGEENEYYKQNKLIYDIIHNIDNGIMRCTLGNFTGTILEYKDGILQSK
jgi:hypothetical protein